MTCHRDRCAQVMDRAHLARSDLKGATLSDMSLIVGTPDWVYTVGLLVVLVIVVLIIAALVKYLRKK